MNDRQYVQFWESRLLYLLGILVVIMSVPTKSLAVFGAGMILALWSMLRSKGIFKGI